MRPLTRSRRGHTLAEALCALALGGVLAAAAGLMLASSRRALEAAELRTIGGRAEREAVAIVRKAMEAGESIIAHGDTAVELDLLIGASVLCASESRALLLPPTRPTATVALSAMPQLPTADDVVLVRRFDGSADGSWWYGVVDSVAERRAAEHCRSVDGWRSVADSAAPLVRLVLDDSVPANIEAGAEVRIVRRGRFALYHIGRGEWAVGWRRCHPWNGLCGSIQPVASPLRPPSAAGFRITSGLEHWRIEARGVGGRGAQAELPR
jgi:hypothetical protein